MPKQSTVRKIKAWAIINKKGYKTTTQIWGFYGVGVSPAQIFSSRKRAEFIRDQPEHLEEVRKGTTGIIPVTISYSLPTPKKPNPKKK